jgi:aminopeptidase N
MLRMGAVVAVAGLAMMLLAVPASADTIGSAGIGDPYYPLDGNGGYDVTHYDIRVGYQPATDELWGTTTVLATATQDLTRFDFDFLLRPTEVRVNNAVAGFVSQEDGELVVTPANRITAGSRMTVVVSYRDTPSTHQRYGRTAWHRTPNGVEAVGYPNIAPWWYPANDHPLDKASYDISVSVPAGLEVISNGRFLGTQNQVNGWLRWNWRSAGPQGTYQTSLVVGDFELNQQTTPDGQQFITAYDTRIANGDAARASVERTPEITEWLASLFGPYPFEAQGGVVVPGYTALENQTRPTYGDVVFTNGSGTNVVAHEMAHQWFGNSVSFHHWRDIWLSEGFAQFAEWMWSEHTGEGTVAERAQNRYDANPPDSYLWDVVPADPGPGDNNFHTAVYYRGAFALQALRVTVGDAVFFEILRSWAAAKRGGDATTEEFIAHAEHVAGRQLDDLFHTWLYTSGKPAVSPNDPFPAV